MKRNQNIHKIDSYNPDACRIQHIHLQNIRDWIDNRGSQEHIACCERAFERRTDITQVSSKIPMRPSSGV